jgi:hypothetical protein
MLRFKAYRLLSKAEHTALLALRNAPHVRAASTRTDPIGLEAHLAWVRSLPPTAHYMAIFYRDTIVGGAHFVVEEKGNRWGFFFAESTPPLVVPMATVCWIEHLFARGYGPLYSLVRRNNRDAARLNA